MGGPSGSSEQTRPLAAGPALASTLGLAAGLAELTATVSGHDELATRARALRDEVEPLGAEDAEAYAAFLRNPDDEDARGRTIEIPGRIALLAAEIAEVAAGAAEQGKPDSRYDAIAGAILADSAAKAAALLVEANLRGGGDPRLVRTHEAVGRAASAVRRALAATTLPSE